MKLMTAFFVSLVIVRSAISNEIAGKTQFDGYDLSCKEFNSRIQTIGVRDAIGNTHPSTLGVTRCAFKSAPINNLKVMMRSQADIEKNHSEICFQMSLKDLVFEGKPEITVAAYQNREGLSDKACSEHVRQVQEKVIQHEMGHAKDCLQVLGSANLRWQKLRPEVQFCSPGLTQSQAIAYLNAKAEDRVREELIQMNKEAEEKSVQLHERIGYGVQQMNCGLCL